MQAKPPKTPKPIRLRIRTMLKTSMGSDDDAWTAAVWIPRYKMVDPSQPLKEILPIILKHYVRFYANRDPALSRKLSEGVHILLLSCTLRVPRRTSESVVSLDSDLRVEILGDLLEDRCSPETVTIHADLTINLQLRRSYERKHFLGNVPDEDIYTFSKMDEEPLEWLRVGDVMVIQEDEEMLGERRAAKGDEHVAYTNPLLASRDPSTGRIQLSTIHAYDFDDFVVGNLEDRRAWQHLGFHVRFLGPFVPHPNTHTSMKQFREQFIDYLKTRKKGETLGSGQPFLPTFCYNSFQAEDYGLGIEKWPKRGVDVAVRCVNHYLHARDSQHIEFPRDIRLIIHESDGIGGLCDQISAHIDTEGVKDEVTVNSHRLFSSENGGRWDMELWIMPQGQRKMFRYVQGNLSQFLDSSEDTRVEDKRLYCEAHIVPKEEYNCLQRLDTS